MGTTTTTFALNKPTVGGDDNAWGTDWNTNADKLDDLLDGTTGITPNLLAGWEVGGVAVTATAAELNILDGVTASAAEINVLDGVTASTAEINILDGVTASTAELNILDGVTLTATQINQGIVPSGAIMHFAMNSAPTGWLKANGANVSRTTYAALFAAIGTTFGTGDGSTTFTLPDLRGEFTRGWDDGRGVDSGRAFGSAQSQEIQSHTHTTTEGNASTGVFSGTNYAMLSNASANTRSVNATGGAETRPRNIALLACIKV